MRSRSSATVRACLGGAALAPNPEAHLFELLRQFDTATVITRGRTDELHGRPMAVADIADDGTLWFITAVDSTKVLEIRGDSRAMPTLQNQNQFVSTNGHFELVADGAMVDQIWKEPYLISGVSNCGCARE